MVNYYSIGKKVRCIDDTGTHGTLKLGEIYTICNVSYVFVYLVGFPGHIGFSQKRFEPLHVKKNKEPKLLW
jgi:hypothetical protein